MSAKARWKLARMVWSAEGRLLNSLIVDLVRATREVTGLPLAVKVGFVDPRLREQNGLSSGGTHTAGHLINGQFLGVSDDTMKLLRQARSLSQLPQAERDRVLLGLVVLIHEILHSAGWADPEQAKLQLEANQSPEKVALEEIVVNLATNVFFADICEAAGLGRHVPPLSIRTGGHDHLALPYPAYTIFGGFLAGVVSEFRADQIGERDLLASWLAAGDKWQVVSKDVAAIWPGSSGVGVTAAQAMVWHEVKGLAADYTGGVIDLRRGPRMAGAINALRPGHDAGKKELTLSRAPESLGTSMRFTNALDHRSGPELAA